jgi:hypothetical protein
MADSKAQRPFAATRSPGLNNRVRLNRHKIAAIFHAELCASVSVEDCANDALFIAANEEPEEDERAYLGDKHHSERAALTRTIPRDVSFR